MSGVPPFQAMSGPTWLPPKQPEPARAPQGRAIPRGTPGPPPAHGAALQPHPRVNFCPLPSEQCYQAPGGPEDRGPAWVGSHGVLQRTQGLPADRGPSPRKPGCRDRLAEQHAGRAEWGSGSCATATRATGIRAPATSCLPHGLPEAEPSLAAPSVSLWGPHSSLLCYCQHPSWSGLPRTSEGGTASERLWPTQAGSLSGLWAPPGSPLSSPRPR